MPVLIIFIVGHNASGKTTLAKKLSEDLKISRITGDDFLDFIKQNVAYYSDLDISYPNDKYTSLKQLKVDYRNLLTVALIKQNQSVIFDASGHTKQSRDQYIASFHQMPEVKTLIIWAYATKAELLQRLGARENQHSNWLKQYREKGPFEPPLDSEADVVLRFDQSNYDDIKNMIQELLG